MAVSRSMEEFGRRLQVVARGIADNVGKTVRKAALVADQVAVLATPVNTGRARANWLVSTVGPLEGAPQPPVGPPTPPGDPRRETHAAEAAQRALEHASAAVAQYELGDRIFIVNNLDYIGPLDEGHSQQAPAGMTVQAVAAATQVLRDAQVLPS